MSPRKTRSGSISPMAALERASDVSATIEMEPGLPISYTAENGTCRLGPNGAQRENGGSPKTAVAILQQSGQSSDHSISPESANGARCPAPHKELGITFGELH